MQKLKPFFSLLTLATLAISPKFAYAEGASFDCAKAASSIEKLICSDQELSDLDKEMAETYNLIGTQNDIRKFKAPQLEWLKERSECADVACLKNKYLIRIGVLQAWAEKGLIDDKVPYVPKVIGDEPGAAVCRQFISEYDFNIKSLKHPLKWTKVPEDNLIEAWIYYGWVHYMDLDVDNDGNKERLYRIVGSLHGYKVSKDIVVAPLDSSAVNNQVNVSEIVKKSLRFIKGNAEEEIRVKKEGRSIYWYDEKNSIQPFYVNGKAYLYLSNEIDPVDQRFYLIVQLKRISGKIVNEEICRLQFNQ